MQNILDTLADQLAIDDLRRNQKPIHARSFVSLVLLFAPGVLFIVVIYLLKDVNVRFAWAQDFTSAPWQFWGIGFFGVIATVGGAGDWIFHKIYVTVGPHEHDSHVLALGAGGLVFIFMSFASITDQPLVWLIPTLIALLLTTTLICYDEFVFHINRCKPIETALHRMLVFGNAIALFIWLHWIFVEEIVYASA